MASLSSKESLSVLTRLEISSDPYIRFNAVKAMVDLHFNEKGVKLDKNKIIEQVQRECDFYLERLTFVKTLLQSFENDGEENAELDISKEHLVNLLQNELNCSMNVIFEILSLVLNEDDMEVAYFGLKDESESVKENAIEFLDNILSVGFKSVIMPLIEYHFAQGRDINNLTDEKIEIGNPTKCIKILLKDGNLDVKLSTLNVVSLLDNPEVYLETLKQLTRHKKAVICNKSTEIIKTIKTSHL